MDADELETGRHLRSSAFIGGSISMRPRIIKIVFLKELREMLRDRRSLAIMFGIPLVLYPLLTVLIGSIGVSKKKELTERPAKVAVVNLDAAPHLADLILAPESGIELTPSSDPDRDLQAGKIDAVLTIPPDAERDALADKTPQITTRLDRSHTSTAFVERKLDKVLDEYDTWIIQQRLRDHGQSVDLLKPLKHSVIDIATADQRFGKLLAMSLPVLLLLTGMLGALYPALNATTTERELGTLETLLVTPAGRMELLVAKGALVLLSALATAALNMLSMSLVLWRSLSLIESGIGSLQISLGSLALTYLAAVPTLITFATLVLIVGLLARNFREANSFATPIMMIPLASLLVGIAEPAMSLGLLVTPVANTTVIIREVLTGRVTVGAFALAFISSTVYAGLFLSLAARVFTNEQLVNPSWEPVSLKGFRAGALSRKRKRRLPGVDEALALFAVALLLSFYIAPSLQRFGFTTMLVVQEALLLAAPALLLAWIGRYRWIETFSWRRAGVLALLGGLLLGVGLSPWMQLAGDVQSRFWPPNKESQEAMMRLLLPPLEHWPILMPLLIGALAGICEETLFRGPIQVGFLRRMPMWTAIIITAILFAAAHLDIWGMPIRTLLGVVLGWIVVRTGSIFPAMLMHGAFDATQLLMTSHQLKQLGSEKLAQIAGAQQGIEIHGWMLAGAALLIGIGLVLLLTSNRRRSAEPPALPAEAAHPA
jgi:sodium transport system permease protein